MSLINGVLKAAFGAAALLSAGAALAATLVVRSNGPSAANYPPGKTLDPSATIALKAGDSITVLDEKGTRVLKGPGNVPVSGSGSASVNGISALLADVGARQARTGATRGNNDGPAHATNVWLVDSSQGGKICLINPARVSLWRPNADAAGSLRVTRLSDNQAISLDFRAGQAVRPWPTDKMQLTDGAGFRLDSGNGKPVTIETTLLDSAPVGLDGTAEALLEKGCTVQVDLLIAATAQQPGA